MLDNPENKKIIDDLFASSEKQRSSIKKQLGLQGIEVYHPGIQPDDVLIKLAW